MALDERLDLFAIKRQFERYAELISLGGLAADVAFLRRARRALLPLPLIDRQDEIDASTVFPPLHPRPIPTLEGKRVALVASGGGGAAVALVGVARAFEEAQIEPAAIVGCSGGAIWGSMWAAGMSAQEMAEFSLRWKPEDYLDVQWLKIPRFALSALRGFTGLAKGEAIERLFDERARGMRCGETPIPIKTIVYNMDLGRVEYFGTDETPDVTDRPPGQGRGRPAAVHRVGARPRPPLRGRRNHRGLADPAGPRRGRLRPCVGVNFMLPRDLEPRDITGWPDRLGGLFEASRQLQQGYHLELARRARAQLGDSLTMIDPIEDSELHGTSFYDLFLDRSHWPRLIRQGYDAATEALDAIRDRPGLVR